MHRFVNRAEAGRELAAMLHAFADRDDVVVLGLPRGGVPVAFEVAQALRAPLDVFIVRKLGLPDYEEYAFGAVATGGVAMIDWRIVDAQRVSSRDLDAVVARERAEIARRERLYRGDRPPLVVKGRTVILVDDGLATGASMHAAVAALRRLQPAVIVVATPVASREAADSVRAVADSCLAAYLPAQLYAVGLWYEDFAQTSDEEVLKLLERAERQSSRPRPVRASAGGW
jgi:predicted phosphoribosyltransferase